MKKVVKCLKWFGIGLLCVIVLSLPFRLSDRRSTAEYPTAGSTK